MELAAARALEVDLQQQLAAALADGAAKEAEIALLNTRWVGVDGGSRVCAGMGRHLSRLCMHVFRHARPFGSFPATMIPPLFAHSFKTLHAPGCCTLYFCYSLTCCCACLAAGWLTCPPIWRP